MIELTQGQTMMALALMIFAAIAIGEVMFRFKRRKLKKEHYHLSDYGIDQMIDRIDFYAAGIGCLLIMLFIVGIVCSIIRLWNIPF